MVGVGGKERAMTRRMERRVKIGRGDGRGEKVLRGGAEEDGEELAHASGVNKMHASRR